MSKQYNVNRDVKDAFYRYKMPAIIAKVEGRGNGIRTVIANMVDIARALNRPPIHPTKYFGCELGAQIHVDAENERYIVNGSHDEGKLQDLLDGFIKKFVLCPSCENPETKLQVKSRIDTINQTCQACGHSGALKHMSHRLSTYIIQQEKHKNSKKKDKKKKTNGDKPSENTEKDIYAGEDTRKAMVPSVKEKKTKEDWEGDDDWEDDEELENGIGEMSLQDMKPADMSLEQKGQAFTEYIKDMISSGRIDRPEASKEISLKAEYYGSDVKTRGPTVLVEQLLDENILTQLQKYRGHFLRLTHEDLKAQKKMVSALESFFERGNEDTLKKCPHIIKKLYDLDIVTEEVLIEWGTAKPSKKYCSKELSADLKKRAEKVIKWLQEAEEETTEEEDSSDDENVAFGEVRENHSLTRAPEAPKEVEPIKVCNEDGEEEEVDIDDI